MIRKKNFPSYNLVVFFLMFEFLGVMNVSDINPCCFNRMNTRRTMGLRTGAAPARGDQNPPQAPPERVAMPVNPAGLTDTEARASLDQMAQANTMKEQAMTAQVNRHDVEMENPPVRSMADRLQDFTRMNPPIFIGANTLEDPQEFIDELHKILVAMGATDIQKAELASYLLKEIA